MAKTVKKVKFPKASKAKPLFEAKFLEREEASSEITDNKENENFFSSTASKIRKNIDKIKIHKIPVFIRKLRKKIRIKSIAIFLKGLRKKVKIRFISEEDQKIKKQLSKTKELIINSESYLGELLKKKKEEDRIISREAESVSFENDVTKGFSNEPIKKNGGIAKLTKLLKKLKKLMTIKNKVIKIVKGMNIRKTEKRESRNIKEEGKFFTKEKIIEKTRTTQNNKQSSAPPKFEISQEAVKKIENKLISEILEDSKNIEAYKRLGKVYYNQDKYHYAAECFKAAIKLGSGDRKIDNLLKECEKKISLPR